MAEADMKMIEKYVVSLKSGEGIKKAADYSRTVSLYKSFYIGIRSKC